MQIKDVLMAMFNAGGILFGAIMFTVIGLVGLVGALSTGNYWMLTMCFMFIGAFFFFRWAITQVDDSLRHKKAQHRLKEHGIETTAQVTFVDYDWSYTINNKPVNSFIEYTFLDTGNQRYQGRDSVNSDAVRRAGLSNGDTVYIVYDPTNPGMNQIVFKTANEESVTDVEPEPQSVIEHKVQHASGVDKQELESRGIEALATVISLLSDTDYTTFIWQFEDRNTQVYKQQFTVPNEFVIKNRIHIHANLKIKYLPDNPNKCAYVETVSSNK